MMGALVTFIAKKEGVVKDKFSGAQPQTPKYFPPIKIPGGATVPGRSLPIYEVSRLGPNQQYLLFL